MVQKDNNAVTEDEWFPPTNDYAFRSLFGSPANLEVTAGFIRDFFGVETKPKNIQILNNEAIDLVALASATEEERMRFVETHRDVTLEIQPAKLTVEMQVIKERNFVKRALHYLTQLYVQTYGSDYGSPDKRDGLKPIWSMNVLAHDRFSGPNPVRVFALREEAETAVMLEGRPLRLGFFEIPKQLEKPLSEDRESLESRRIAWAHFFEFGIATDWAPAYIKLAASIMEKMNADPKELMMLKAAERARDDRIANEHGARLEGHAEGKAEMAMEMFREHEPFEKVAKYSKLKPEVLEALRQKVELENQQRGAAA